MTAFDAYHVACVGETPIISSDGAYDALDLEPIALDPEE